MTKTFSDFIDECELALSDATNMTWLRNTIIAWAKEGILAFPILRPVRHSYAFVSACNYVELLEDFREMVSVQYPLSEEPPAYLIRMNRLDPDFWASDDHYDYDFNYDAGKGWMMYASFDFAAETSVEINYLATHDAALADDDSDTLTINDEHLHILMAYIVQKAWTERLSNYMRSPTAQSNIMYHVVHAVKIANQNYTDMVDRSLSKLAASRPTPKLKVDPYDRVY